METKKIVDTLLQEGTPEMKLSEIFTIRYKEGPVLKSINIKARDSEHAYAEAQKFLLHVQSRENHRVVLVGKPEPLAIVVDDEIEKWTRKNRPNLNQEKIEAMASQAPVANSA